MRTDLHELTGSPAVERHPAAAERSVGWAPSGRDSELTPRVLAAVEAAVGHDAFRLWFSGPISVTRNGQAVEVEVANDFLADCIRSFCISELRTSIYRVMGDELAVRVRTAASTATATATAATVVSREATTGRRGRPTEAPVQPTLRRDAPSSPPPPHSPAMRRQVPNAAGQMQTALRSAAAPRAADEAKPAEASSSGTAIESARGGVSAGGSVSAARPIPHFVGGESNRFALAAVNMVVERPGEFGPLFVCGPTGSGKTHLSKMIAERLRGLHRFRRVVRMTGEQFTIDFMDSTRGGGFAAFRRKYRDVDTLIIDDVHFLLGKSATIAELRHTVDELTGRRRQVVLTSNRSLAELTGLGPELHARLSGGVTAAIEPLDDGVRRELLGRLCAEHGVGLDAATIETLATRTAGDGRAIYGLVFRLLAQQRSGGGSITREQAIGCTLDLLRAGAPAVRMCDVERVVCQQFGVVPQQLQGASRSRAVCGARMLAMFLARKHTGAAYSEIGRYFGKRQHSTVIAAQKRVEQWLACDEEVSLGRGAARVQALLRAAEASLQAG